jgi:hypothetical protein
MESDSEGSLRDFIADDDDDNTTESSDKSSNESDGSNHKPVTRITRSKLNNGLVEGEPYCVHVLYVFVAKGPCVWKFTHVVEKCVDRLVLFLMFEIYFSHQSCTVLCTKLLINNNIEGV